MPLNRATTSLLRLSSIGVVIRSIALGISIVTNLWIARDLGPAEYGTFVLAVVLQGAVALVSNLGVGSALAYDIAQDPGGARRSFSLAFVLSGLTLAITLPSAWLVLVVGAAPHISQLAFAWIGLALILAVPRVIQELFGAVCTGLGLLERTFAQNASGPVIFLAALVVARALGPLTPADIAAAWVISNVGATAFGAVLTIRLLPRGAPRDGHLRLRAGSFAWFGAQQTLNLAAWWSLMRINRTIIAGVAGTDDVGRFAVSAAMAEIVMYIPNVIQLSLFTRIARTEVEDAAMEVRRSIRVALVQVALVSIAITLGALWFIEPLLGPAYRDVVPTFIALVPGLIGLTPVTIIATFFLARLGRPALNLIPTAVSLLVLIPAVWTFGERWGIVGAGIGTSVAYLTAGVVAVILFVSRRKIGRHGTATHVPPIVSGV